jgi:hypothetical protein
MKQLGQGVVMGVITIIGVGFIMSIFKKKER